MDTVKLITENDRIVFHFNKKHLEDSKIPMWTIKCKGESYYVNHLDSSIGFSTKETPLNPVTKGSIMFRGKLSIVENNNQIIAIIE